MGMQLSSNRTRLHLRGVGSAITADVARRRPDGLVVTQPLPFLRLDSSVTEGGRRSRIKRVAIAMDGDVPQLLLELHHEQRTEEDDTEESFTPGMSAHPARTDSTVPYGFETKPAKSPIVLRDHALPAMHGSEREPTWLTRTWRRVLSAFTTMLRPASS